MSQAFFINIFPTLDRRQEVDLNELVKKVCLDSSDMGVSHTLMTVGDKRLDPWIVAQNCMEKSSDFKPIIAINPLTANPVDTAKRISSLYAFYGREVALNIVSGSFFNELRAHQDYCSFTERSARVMEFFTCVLTLLKTGKLTYEGHYFSFNGVDIHPRYFGPPVKFFLSGALSQTSQEHDETFYVKNIKPLDELPPAEGRHRGLALGICARQTCEEAYHALETLFPEDRTGEMLFEMSLNNSETPWNTWLRAHRHRFENNFDYCLKPISRFLSAAPFIVSSYERTAEMLKEYENAGYSFFMLDYHLDDALHVAEVIRRHRSI